LNKSDKYIDEINALKFADDIKDRIMRNILMEKRRRLKISAVLAVLLIAVLAVPVMNISKVSNENDSDILYEDADKKLSGAESVKSIQTEVNQSIDEIEVAPGQALIIQLQNLQDNVDSFILDGYLTGKEINYSWGYIIDQNYNEVQFGCTEESIQNQMDVISGSRYSVYIFNTSDFTLTFCGEVQTNSNDLVYRDYGSEAVRVDGKGTIIIDLSGLNSEDIDGIYVYNCDTQTSAKLTFSNTIEYEIEQAGVYLIYAITTTGEKTDLSGNVTIQQDVMTNGTGITQL